MKDANIIPVADITQSELTEEQVMEQARAQAAEQLASAKNFLLIEVDEKGCQIIAGCNDVQVMQGALALASMVGAAQIGEAMERMPPAIANVVALTQGLGSLNSFAREAAGEAGAHLNGQSDSKH
uniref:Uncharacterized protein n=1 Tax=viral metagenome TaxID=1070528 RepID=A0A6M3M6S0_9ZZZZ